LEKQKEVLNLYYKYLLKPAQIAKQIKKELKFVYTAIGNFKREVRAREHSS
jgi:hypothetical protein